MALSMTNSVADVLAQQAAAQAPAAAPAPTPAPQPAPSTNLNGYTANAQPQMQQGLIASAAQAQQQAAAAPAPANATDQWTGVAVSPTTPAAATNTSGLANPNVSITGQPGSGSVAVLGTPKSWDVTSDQTVEGRINSIINSNNPIIQQARTRAAETMNGRGLLNSSLALTAGEAAAYQAATPIATADAATAAKSASYNADEANQFGIKNQEAINAHAIAQLNTETQKQLQQMQNDNQKLLQTNNQAATAFNQALVSMTAINQNEHMDAAAKTQAVAQIQRDLQTQLKVLSSTSGLNLSAQLNFAGYDGFDDQGNYVGFGDAGAVAPTALTPAQAQAQQQANLSNNYYTPYGAGSGNSGGDGSGAGAGAGAGSGGDSGGGGMSA